MTREAYLKQLEDSLFKDKDDWMAFISLTKAAQELKDEWKKELVHALNERISDKDFDLIVENWEKFWFSYISSSYNNKDYLACIFVEGPNVHLWVRDSQSKDYTELVLSNGWQKRNDNFGGQNLATKRWLPDSDSLNFSDMDALAWEIHNNRKQIAEQISSVVNEGLQVFKEILTPSNSNKASS